MVRSYLQMNQFYLKSYFGGIVKEKFCLQINLKLPARNVKKSSEIKTISTTAFKISGLAKAWVALTQAQVTRMVTLNCLITAVQLPLATILKRVSWHLAGPGLAIHVS